MMGEAGMLQHTKVTNKYLKVDGEIDGVFFQKKHKSLQQRVEGERGKEEERMHFCSV